MTHQEGNRRANVRGADPTVPSGGVRTPPVSLYPRGRKPSRARAGIPCRVKTPTGERTIGCVVDGPHGPELVKHVRESKHLFRSADAWGLDAKRAEDLRQSGVLSVRVHDLETGVSYHVSLDYLLEHGFRLDFGHGEQVFLPRRLWARSDDAQLGLFVH